MRSSRTNSLARLAATAGLLVITGCSSLRMTATLTIDPDFPTITVEDEKDETDGNVLDTRQKS